MRKLFSKFALVATLGLALTFTFNCSSGNSSGNEPGGGGGGGSIVNAENEAWVRCKPEKCYDSGLIFKQNGEYAKVGKEDNGSWCIEGIYAYSTNGNQLCVGNKCMDYSISGNILTIVEGGNDKPTFTRTSGVYVNGTCSDRD